MKNDYIISSRNFDKEFKILLKNKNKKCVIKSKFDFENVCVSKKIGLIKFLITDKNLAGNIVYKILFLGKRPVLCSKCTK
ncbi:hypothetical protein [Campylobacter concisus]